MATRVRVHPDTRYRLRDKHTSSHRQCGRYMLIARIPRLVLVLSRLTEEDVMDFLHRRIIEALLTAISPFILTFSRCLHHKTTSNERRTDGLVSSAIQIDVLRLSVLTLMMLRNRVCSRRTSNGARR